MKEEINKKVEIEKLEWDFWVWVYEIQEDGDKYTSIVWNSKDEAMKYIPNCKNKILVKFTIEKKDFDQL